MALRNSDFRSLLEKGSSDKGASKAGDAASDPAAAAAAAAAKKKKERVWVKKAAAATAEAKLKEAHAKYRDRATERRKNVNSDYQESDEIVAQGLAEDMTKFLGGDETHTHLVKGLDLSLLRKTQEDMDKSRRLTAQMLRASTSVPGTVLPTFTARSQLAKGVYAFVKAHAAEYTSKHAAQESAHSGAGTGAGSGKEKEGASARAGMKVWANSTNERYMAGRTLFQFDLPSHVSRVDSGALSLSLAAASTASSGRAPPAVGGAAAGAGTGTGTGTGVSVTGGSASSRTSSRVPTHVDELPKTIIVSKEDCPVVADDLVSYCLDMKLLQRVTRAIELKAQRKKSRGVHEAGAGEGAAPALPSPARAEPPKVPAEFDVDDMFGDGSDADTHGDPKPLLASPKPPTAVPAEARGASLRMTSAGIDETDAFDPFPAQYRNAPSASQAAKAQAGDGSDSDEPPTAATAAGPGAVAKAKKGVSFAPAVGGGGVSVDDLLSDEEGEGEGAGSHKPRPPQRVANSRSLQAIKNRIKQKLDNKDEGGDDEFDQLHSVAVVDSDDDDVTTTTRAFRAKAGEFKETLAATAAVSVQVDKERLKRLKETGAAPPAPVEVAGSAKAVKKLAELNKRKIDTTLNKIEKLIDERKEKRSKGLSADTPASP